MIFIFALLGVLLAFFMDSVWLGFGSILLAIALFEFRHRFNEDEISKLRDMLNER